MLLGVNIDHIAVLREARKVNDPDIMPSLWIAKEAGAEQITLHLREDRRHINNDDVKNVVRFSPLPVNIECSTNEEIIGIVSRLHPHRATIVPEKRRELTTESGLQTGNMFDQLLKTTEKLRNNDISVSLFIEPDIESIKVAKEISAHCIEFHTGRYANIYAALHSNIQHTPYACSDMNAPRAELHQMLTDELAKLKEAAVFAKHMGLEVAAGHGLNYQNVSQIVKISEIKELNIGQAIVARSVYSGLKSAIEEMVKAINS